MNKIYQSVMPAECGKCTGLYFRFRLLLLSVGLLLSGAASVSAAATSQDQKISVSLNNGTLPELFEQIQRQSDYLLFYKDALLSKKQLSTLTLQVQEEEVTAILDQVLQPRGLAYKLAGRQIIIIPGKPSEAAPPRAAALPADVLVRGGVTDEKGEALFGVSIGVKGTSIGTTTNETGAYSLTAPAEGVLVFSYVGMIGQEVPLNGQTLINVQLKGDSKALSEVVVTAIGIEANKRALGYSIQNVEAEQIIKSKETNLVSALSGKAAGVVVTSSSGSPGASANITIRGNKSISGSNKPLFVVDGVPVDNSSSGNSTGGVDVSNRAIDINPNDIESMSVLKGPAATALYGIRAANGAVIITTKRGAKGKPQIAFNTSYSFDRVNKLPELQREYAQGTISGGAFVYRGPDAASATINSWGPKLTELEFDGRTDYPYDKNGSLVAVGTGNGMPARAYDQYDAFFATGHTWDNNVAVSGGGDKTTYYFSAGRLYQTGIVPNADFSRNSFKSNVNFELSKKFSVGSSATFVNSGGNRIQRGSNVSGVMTSLLRNPTTFDIGNGRQGRDAAGDPATYVLPDGRQRRYNTTYDNPFWSVNRVPYKDNVNRIIGNLNFEFKFTEWLKLRYKIGLDNFSDQRDAAWDINSASNVNGAVNQSLIASTALNSDLLLLASRDLTPDLHLDAIVGHNFFNNVNTVQASDGNNLGVAGFYDISNASVVTSRSNLSRRKVFGAFGDFKLGYKDWLFLNLTGRNDWSSTLPQANNSFFYPTASLAVDLTEAFAMANHPLLSYAKIRVSYGQVGNDAPIYSTNTYYNRTSIGGDDLLTNSIFPIYGVSGFEREISLSNNKLKAERTSTLEFGGDFKFFRGKLGMDVTYYVATTRDQIVRASISATSGYTDQLINAGKIENKGVELVLSGTPVSSGDFSWDASLNFTRSRNTVKELPTGISQITLQSFTALSSLVMVGQPYGVLSGTRYQRDEQNRVLIGSDGWPLIAATQGPIGNPNPDWLTGINNTLSYKALGLSFLWDIRQGGDIWNATRAFNSYLGTSKESGDQRSVTGHVFEGVKVNGEVNTTPVDFANPANGLNGIYWRRGGTFGVSENYIEDGSWVRLRELTLSYKVPAGVLNKVASRATVSFYGRNLLLFTDYSGVDPETNLTGDTNATGWDYYNLPNTRSYGATLNVTF
ncbi:TonB-dependent receptor plug [Hymenobacter roseosalivarius DSM 11622]|uniref:TonB-dependent receptor plug n=1 Tax=Hymenobacter roseosalivarius DSM 11622 TaxID=645990 RepID=A0A1W1UGC9_9BACT|nr:SusC/RagA family TonB-linked outer membrane protein [Hymenobacter roseosalivarius]SMB80137.1 TonB-dependent receptor plug [Hymenobacter roseosalivarius DSM 11622]